MVNSMKWLAAGVLCASALSAHAQVNQIRVWAAACANCHGTDGKAEPGMADGFDLYEADIDVRATESLGNSQRSGRETSRAALSWVKSVSSEPFFLFFHIYEPHTPYAPEPAFAGIPDPYDGEVATADAVVGELLDDSFDRHRVGILHMPRRRQHEHVRRAGATQ